MSVILVPVASIAAITAATAEVEIPGLSDITSKLISECGISSGILVGICALLGAVIIKILSAWKEDREGLLKIIENQNASVDNLTASLAKVEGILLGFQARKVE